jgi:hypothetical protein
MCFVCVFEAVYVCVSAGQSKTGSIVKDIETLLMYGSISEGHSVEKLGNSFFEVCNVDVSQKQLPHLCR